ncbi:MAG: xanthine dehydrogenase, partial [Calditrichaeota bacterium]|nr:xanthine dehydrogenase [Calditrichota bacterium]
MKFNIVGKPVIRPDGYAKVTGKAKFADDWNLPNQLYGVAVRLPASHAKIKSIDFSAIENAPGLVTICDWRDVPGKNKVGIIRHDQPIFCNEKIVTPGDVVALLVGEDEQNLRSLAEQVKFEIEELPVLTDPRRALESDAPLVHP